ncbi:MAG: hypothetical protein ACOYOB_18475 [Myxococcota bacterium]
MRWQLVREWRQSLRQTHAIALDGRPSARAWVAAVAIAVVQVAAVAWGLSILN